MKKVCVFAGSSEGLNPVFKEFAFKVGQIVAKNKFELLYGGAQVGLMGAVANGCLNKGGKVEGIIPEFLTQKEVMHPNITKTIITKSMHERKKIMYDKAHLFLVLPGGVGSLDELMEVLTWKQLNLLNQKVIIFNIEKYWDDLLKLLFNIYKNSFMDKKNLYNYIEINNLEKLELELSKFKKKI